MKKIIFSILIITSFILCSCKEQRVKDISQERGYKVYHEEIDGHDYLVFVLARGYSCSISSVHNENCQCKKE